MRTWRSAGLVAFATVATNGVARADVPDEIKVHVDGDPDLVVERRIEDTELWESVCTGACDRKLPLGGRYRLLGRGIRESLWIALVPPEHHDALHLDVKAAYSTAWGGGIALVALGAATIFAGTIALAVGANQGPQVVPCPFDVTCPEPRENNSMAIAGGMTLIVGALMAAGGTTALILGSQTRVHQVATLTLTPRGVAVTF